LINSLYILIVAVAVVILMIPVKVFGLTVSVRVVLEVCPVEFRAVTVNAVAATAELTEPVRPQVLEFKIIPAGSAGLMVQDAIF